MAECKQHEKTQASIEKVETILLGDGNSRGVINRITILESQMSIIKVIGGAMLTISTGIAVGVFLLLIRMPR